MIFQSPKENIFKFFIVAAFTNVPPVKCCPPEGHSISFCQTDLETSRVWIKRDKTLFRMIARDPVDLYVCRSWPCDGQHTRDELWESFLYLVLSFALCWEHLSVKNLKIIILSQCWLRLIICLPGIRAWSICTIFFFFFFPDQVSNTCTVGPLVLLLLQRGITQQM